MTSPIWQQLYVPDLLALLDLRDIRAPYPLAEVAQVGYDQIQERRSVIADASHRTGGGIDESLSDLASVCGEYHDSIDLRFTSGSDEIAALALHGPSGTWVIHADGPVGRFVRCPAHLAVATLLSVLRPLPGTRSRSISIPEDLLIPLTLAGEPGVPRADRDRLLRAAGLAVTEYESFLSATGAVAGAGQIGAGRRVDSGEGATRAARVVAFLDTAGGRLISSPHEQQGRTWITLQSAGPAELHRAAAGLIQTLVG